MTAAHTSRARWSLWLGAVLSVASLAVVWLSAPSRTFGRTLPFGWHVYLAGAAVLAAAAAVGRWGRRRMLTLAAVGLLALTIVRVQAVARTLRRSTGFPMTIERPALVLALFAIAALIYGYRKLPA